MLIQRQSPFSGRINVRDIDITSEQLARWAAGELIQDVMPKLPPDDREFIMTGITPEEWGETFIKPLREDVS